MYRPTLKKKHAITLSARVESRWDPVFEDPVFFKPMESGPCFLYPSSNTVIIIALQNFTQGAYT